MQEKEFRSKITQITFLFSIFVIWVHSYNIDLFSRGAQGPSWESAAQIEHFLSISLGQAAVPGFFMVSSYLFFRTYEPSKLLSKWKGRLVSIVMPYISWNILYYLGYVLASRIPYISKVVGKKPIPFSMEEIFASVFQYRYAPIFWYLYQLIILLILAPVIYYLVKNRIVGLCYLAVLLTMIRFHVDCAHPNTDALFYFSTAAYLAVHLRKQVERKYDGKQVLAAGLFLLMAAGFFFMALDPENNVIYTVLYRLMAPAGLWLLIPEMTKKTPPPYMRQSLFLYAIHFIFVRFINKGAAMAGLAGSEAAAILVYFAIPVLVVIFSYLTARFLSRFLPGVFWVLSGGRSLDQ